MRTRSRRGRSWAISLALMALVAPAAALPPGPEEEEVPADLLISDWKLGPFYAKPSFGIENVGWDDNVYLSPEGEEQKDFTATVKPGLRLALPFGDSAFTIRQLFAYVWFQDAASERGLDSDTELKLDLLAGGIRLALSETFRSTRERFETEITSRPRRLENRFDAVLDTDREAGIYFEGSFGYNAIRFSSDEEFEGKALSLQLDRDELRAGLAGFLQFGDTRLMLGGELDSNKFQYFPEAKDASGYFVFTGIRFEPGHAVTGDFRIGYRSLDVKPLLHPDYEELAFRGDIDVELGEAARLRLEASREPWFSIFGSNLYYAATRLKALFRLPAGDRFAFELSPLWVKAKYPLAEPTTSGVEVKREDTVSWVELAGVIKFTEGAGLRLGVLRRNLDSNFEGIGYSNFVFTMGLSYGD